ncbi:MarR family winged helix-turn-helix transcriptional regulator [Streptomyces gamaensis]|uniref:MarR family winged helix-turn-helix transcriptional regulator n=1 Tax=Streptomyces gamaensis TaxID=1763542 RepID=A0ABW0YVX1_9ACTN
MTTESTRPDTPPLTAQPIGYWSWLAHKAVVSHLRAAMARMDITQPQWWTLKHIDTADPVPTRDELCERLGGFLDMGPEAIGHAVDALVARGWLAPDAAGRLWPTEAGREGTARIKALLKRLRSQIHDGIPEDDYATTLTVLRRMIRNVGGEDALHSA